MTDRIRQIFKDLQFLLFSLLVLGIIASLLFDVFGRGADLNVILRQFLSFLIFFYLPIVFLLLIFQLTAENVGRIQLYLFYELWIRGVLRGLQHNCREAAPPLARRLSHWALRRYFNEYYDALILESWVPTRPADQYSTSTQQESFQGRPVFVRREHLLSSRIWPHWAFATVLLFNRLRMMRTLRNERTKMSLEIDLRYQSHGIYNNAGKVFIAEKFLREDTTDVFARKAQLINAFLREDSAFNVLEFHLADTPLRWASGGVLPIARWRKRDWYVLAFRGITPVGWNLMNGSAENKDEYKHLRTLMVRELYEELVLLNRKPQVDDPSPLHQKVFRLTEIFDAMPKDFRHKITSREFAAKQIDLRRQHDNLTINFTEGPALKPVETPFEIRVHFHAPNLKDSQEIVVEDVVFSVNPFEFGVESVSLYSFAMDDEDYLMFGEIWEVGDCLIREPLLLLSCTYVEETYHRNGGSLGTLILEKPHADCKTLERVPVGEYHLFDQDIELRKRRRDRLAQRSRTLIEGRELDLHNRWLERYEQGFRSIQGRDIVAGSQLPLASLCPVTWKTLELVCRYGILNPLKKR